MSAVQNGYASEIQGIPIPKVEAVTDSEYDLLYPTGYKKEKELYRVQGLSCKYRAPAPPI